MADLKAELLEIRRKHGYVNPRLAFEVVREDRAAWPALDSLVGDFWDNVDSAWEWACQERIRQGMKRLLGVTYSEESGAKSLNEYRGRSFYAIKQEGQEPVWEPVEAVVEDPVLKKIVLAEMERSINDLVGRYQHLQEFAPAMSRALKRLRAKAG